MCFGSRLLQRLHRKRGSHTLPECSLGDCQNRRPFAFIGENSVSEKSIGYRICHLKCVIVIKGKMLTRVNARRPFLSYGNSYVYFPLVESQCNLIYHWNVLCQQYSAAPCSAAVWRTPQFVPKKQQDAQLNGPYNSAYLEEMNTKNLRRTQRCSLSELVALDNRCQRS